MRVSIVAAIDPLVEKPGGTRTYVMNLVSRLAEKNIDFSVIGVDFDATDGSPPYDFVPAVISPEVSSVRYLRGLMRVAKKTRFSEDTIIHAQRPDYLFPFIFRGHTNKKICTLHGQLLRSVRERKGAFYGTAYNLLESYAMKGADHVISVDQSTQDVFFSKYPFLAEKSSLIPVGINVDSWGREDRAALRERLNIPPGAKMMLYVGRLEKEKNVDLIVESLPIVRKAVEDCSLVIIGSGTQRKKLEVVSERLGLEAVHFMESQPSEVVRDFMAAADVFCLASSFESGPLVVLESLASGTPVVSTNVGMVKKFMPDPSTGRIVPREKEAIAGAVVELLRFDREEIAEKCVSRASEFGFEKTFEKTLELYEALSLTNE